MTQTLLEIRDLHLAMTSFDGSAHVLNGINLRVARQEIWGLVGETGCGKSLTGLSISRLVPTPPARYISGEILFEGVDLLRLGEPAVQALRGHKIGMIFQDPTTNLNPVFRVGEQLMDVALAAARREPAILGIPTTAGRGQKRKAARQLAGDMLEKVGIPNARDRLDHFPHEFSGGMRQRVLIAMALIGRPDLLIADEPTTALDVSVQAQILTVLKGMVAEHDMGVVMITHNLGVVAQTCTHVAVMYAGNIVESGSVRSVLENPMHPYTQALLSALPTKNVRRGDLRGLPGAVPNLINPPPGCRFAPRCHKAQPACQVASPPAAVPHASHAVACLFPETKETVHA